MLTSSPIHRKNANRGGGDADPDPEDSSTQPTEGTPKMVCGQRRGYSYYPAFLFDEPPSKLNIEHLCRKYLIAEIERSTSEKLFYERAINFMGFLTESVHSFAGENGFQFPGSQGSSQKPNEHDYSMVNIQGDVETSQNET